MKRFGRPAEAATWCAGVQERGDSLGFVPTMGALHEGHLELVRRAVAENDATCVSIFVNPLQFNEAGDFDSYPRDFDADAGLLEGVGCSMAFTGDLAGFFPDELDGDGKLVEGAWVDAGPRALGLEGEHRPGHFAGVATIVDRLFDTVGPTRAYFGAKDFQQTLVIEDLAERRGGPGIVRCDIVRETSGLARSSRNERLSPRGRAAAAGIHGSLVELQIPWDSGERDPRALEALLGQSLSKCGFEVEYAALRDPVHWTPGRPAGPLREAVALVAVWIDGVRLIDNRRFVGEGRSR